VQEETNIGAVSDPLAGSYYVEALTDQLARAAEALAAEVEELGGFIAAQESGWIRTFVEDSAQRWRRLVESGDRRMVGVNTHVTMDPTEERIFQVDADVERIAVERLEKLRAERDSKRFTDSMERFEAAAHEFAGMEPAELGDDTLVEAAIDAARADATTGEMMGVLKSALGWRAPHES
jgi:methylmalonyl-CoA mutase N-terminal domain/subunit